MSATRTNSPPKKPELGKWGCWRFFAAVPAIRPYLPETAKFTPATLRQFLSKHRVIYFKPTAGWGGRGITKVWQTASGYAYVRERGLPVHCRTLEELQKRLQAIARPGITHLVQRAIPLAELGGRPFDIRLMMMRVHGRWEYVGMLAKVAGPNSVVTNLGRGKGYVTDVDTALRKSLHLSDAEIAKRKQEMVALGYKTVQRFDDYKRYYQIGLDLAVDKNGRIWLIEENTGPAHFLFAKLKDKRMYNRIKQIAAIWRQHRKASRA